MVNLTEKQDFFCREYIKDFNGTQAAIRAGYSKRTAGSIAGENLKKPEIQERLSVLISKRNEKVGVDAEYVLRRLVEIDALDVVDILDEQGNLLPVTEWPLSWRRSISGIDLSKLASAGDDEKAILTVLQKIKWPDKLRNLELLGKHVSVRAWEKEPETAVDDMAAALREMAERLPA